jgi:hypothetical protein
MNAAFIISIVPTITFIMLIKMPRKHRGIEDF